MIKIKVKEKVSCQVRGKPTELVNDSLNAVFGLYRTLRENNIEAAKLFLNNLPKVIKKCHEDNKEEIKR